MANYSLIQSCEGTSNLSVRRKSRLSNAHANQSYEIHRIKHLNDICIPHSPPHATLNRISFLSLHPSINLNVSNLGQDATARLEDVVLGLRILRRAVGRHNQPEPREPDDRSAEPAGGGAVERARAGQGSRQRSRSRRSSRTLLKLEIVR